MVHLHAARPLLGTIIAGLLFLLACVQMGVSRPDSVVVPSVAQHASWWAENAGLRGRRVPGICRLRGGGAPGKESRHDMNERWRNEARDRKRLEQEACAAEVTPSEPSVAVPPVHPAIRVRRDLAAGVLMEKHGEEERAIPRATLLAQLCERQQVAFVCMQDLCDVSRVLFRVCSAAICASGSRSLFCSLAVG